MGLFSGSSPTRLTGISRMGATCTARARTNGYHSSWCPSTYAGLEHEPRQTKDWRLHSQGKPNMPAGMDPSQRPCSSTAHPLNTFLFSERDVIITSLLKTGRNESRSSRSASPMPSATTTSSSSFTDPCSGTWVRTRSLGPSSWNSAACKGGNTNQSAVLGPVSQPLRPTLSSAPSPCS